MRREEEEEPEERTVCEFCEDVLPDSGIHIPPLPLSSIFPTHSLDGSPPFQPWQIQLPLPEKERIYEALSD